MPRRNLTYLVKRTTPCSGLDKRFRSLLTFMFVILDMIEVHKALDQTPIIIDEVREGPRECEDHLSIRPCVVRKCNLGLDALASHFEYWVSLSHCCH